MVDILTLANVRAIAVLHGIDVSSRCNATLLRSYIDEHSCSDCSKCMGHITVFSIEKSAAAKQVDRSAKSTMKANASALKASAIPISFPPVPASKDLEHVIIRDACKCMDPENFEEVGSAVCSELKLRKNTSHLKSVKNILKILEAPGVT